MRHLILLLALFTLSLGTVKGQDVPANQVPEAVTAAFSSDFSNARDIEWEKNPSFYEVEFETRWGRDHEARYDSDGNLLYHKEEIPNREIPDEITNRINTEFEGYKIDDADKIIEGEQTRYLLSLEAKGMDDIDVLIGEDGEIISQIYDD
ncbi:PepSY-like domain-containing protein [Rhodohalobacter sp. 614A]|uniref:PepSY-like domain-containing protein n=1 Tax=Rhodohalobacter sp. 614A TaxID=2908649 RepID=UPI001F4801A0|nr:PepSY-like domain-containing protein [Rhodohalobacter sp. 614A]